MKPFTIFNRLLTVTLTSVTSVTLLTASCKKDPSPNPNPTGNKLVKIENSANNYVALAYDGSGKLSKLTAVASPETEVINLTYTNNKVATATSASNAIKFNYDGIGQLQQADVHAGNLQGPLASYLKFNYQNNVLNNITTYAKFPGEDEALPFFKTSF
jgi:hypothetical protein